MSDNPVVHFEMPYEDAERVADFYKKAFGWNMVNMGQQMGDYITAGTAETDENRMVKTPGTINGGFYPLSSAPDSKEPSVVISVNDIKKATEDIKQAGGKMLGEPIEIPGIGLYVSFKDTEGNRASILQPNERS
ncbi:MAG TPA: VOC family protein [Candidatus Saccharimonadales bacterium]|nr:VOC family protein [Candidatus Saccharimonadales bacterium]